MRHKIKTFNSYLKKIILAFNYRSVLTAVTGKCVLSHSRKETRHRCLTSFIILSYISNEITIYYAFIYFFPMFYVTLTLHRIMKEERAFKPISIFESALTRISAYVLVSTYVLMYISPIAISN